MTFFQALILGVIEGITEFLPISSTGHLILASQLLSIPADEFTTTFEIAIQLGAIAAVVVVYGHMVITNRSVLKRVAAAFVPTGIAGFLLYPFIKDVLLENVVVVITAMVAGGVGLLIFEYLYASRSPHAAVQEISYKQAVLIGIFQIMAFIPGVSRAAATIIGGLLLGIERKTIVEFSFLLAVPTMVGAAGFDMLKTAGMFSGRELFLVSAGFVVSFLVAFAVMRWLVRYVQHHTFVPFGIYRIVVGLLAGIALL